MNNLFKFTNFFKESPKISTMTNESPSEIKNCLKNIQSTLSELELSVSKSIEYENIRTLNTPRKVGESLSDEDFNAYGEEESIFSDGSWAARHSSICYHVMYNQLKHQKETLLEKDSQLGEMEEKVKMLRDEMVYCHEVVSELQIKYQRLKKNRRMKSCYHKVQVRELLHQLRYIRKDRDKLIDIFLKRETDPQIATILYEMRRSNTLLQENLHLKHRMKLRKTSPTEFGSL